jgi:uroporphyrinogen III methyltransferase / synthase
VSGIVYLVGAGPGDPGLMTRRSLELIATADAILYDRLIPPGALDGARPDAELRYVGKEPGAAALSQEDTNALLVELGRAGKRVVRLKGGDPFVFGRGGEEALALAEADVPFELVPGVSSLAAVPAAAGIPLTHRGVSAGVRVISGTAAETPVDAGTVVVFMGLRTLTRVCEDLIADGLDPSTPAAVISRGTLPDQEVVVAELGQLAEAAVELEPPALVVVGEVVALRERLHAPALEAAG